MTNDWDQLNAELNHYCEKWLDGLDKHLWEARHAYYCNEDGYYYSANRIQGWGAPLSYQTFNAFLEEWSDVDLDMNLLFRWDWSRLLPSEYEEDYGEFPDHRLINKNGYVSELKLFFMMQRKGCKKVVTITNMKDEDEPKVIAWLKPRWEHLKKIWEPVP